MALQSSPSSSNRFNYDVFLSFRGSDTRYNFTGNLYKALCDRGIRTFIDDRELQGGEEITPALFKYIEDSRIFIPVLSKNYASSSFCLDELVYIIECSKTNDRLVLPIFYDVEPTHLRHNTGSYSEAIAKHEVKFQDNMERNIHNMERLQKWKAALNQAANLAGHTFNLDGKEYEYEFIRKIVDLVSKKISCTPLHVSDCRVGLESRVLQVKSLLNMGSDDGVYMVGIHGMGGIGKTTLAREIYNSISNQFEVSCFLDDVRQNTHQNLQEILLHETIREKDIKFGSVSKGISVLKQRLHTKKVLLILDDVDDLKQLEALVGGHDWFGCGSRIIITTRDLHLLRSHGIEKTYEVKELNKDEALELLSWKAFRNNKVDPSYKHILSQALGYASGLPLALEVVGSNLFGKHLETWKPTLAQYKRNTHKNIQKILRVSFDALERDEQRIFLDIACFFKKEKIEDVERILCAHHGHCIKYLIEVLVDKSLIKIDQGGYLILHDLIEDMGKDIVQQESPIEPGERSRLWFYKDILSVLEENSGTSKIEIIYLKYHIEGRVDWNVEVFKKMKNLKTLIICNWYSSKDPEYFPSSLRVLESKNPSSKFIPSIFLSKNFENMTILKSDSNQYLTNIPDVSGLPNLEVLSFKFCYSLVTIHESVGFSSKLKILDVESCKNLRSFPPVIKLPSLQVLELSLCQRLESFPEISGEMKNITELFLPSTSIKELPYSFQNLTGLCRLTIGRVRLPISILNMPKLSEISASDCELLQTQNDNLSSVESSNLKIVQLKYCYFTDEILSIILKFVTNVEELDLEGSYFTILPESIKECHSLGKLSLARCEYLEEIRGIPPNLKFLSAMDCIWLTSSSCRSMLMNQKLHEGGGTEFCFPSGIERIPEWFEHQSKGPSISFWFRKSLPSIALFFRSKAMRGGGFLLRVYLTINGDEYPLCLPKAGLSQCYGMQFGHTYLFDARLQDMGLELTLNKELLKNEWIHAKVFFLRR